MKKLTLILLLLPTLAYAKAKAKQEAPQLSPIRPFVGADLVWSLNGDAVMGPDAAPVVDKFVSQPADLGAGCSVGDMKLSARAVEITVTCADGKHVAQALLGKGQPFAIELWSGAAETLAPVRDELTRRFNSRAAEIPLTASRLIDKDPQVTPDLAPWQAASQALIAADLSAAGTAVDEGVTRGVAGLASAPGNQLKAATILTAVLRGQGKDWKSKVKAFAAPLVKDEDLATRTAAQVLMGKGQDAVAVITACRAAETPCAFAPVVDALVAVGRAGEAATLLAKLAEAADAQLDVVRLAVGVAELAGNHALYLQLATQLTQRWPDNVLGWDNLVTAHLRLADARAALLALLRLPTDIAALPAMLGQLSALTDALWDSAAPEALTAEQRAELLAAAQPAKTATQQLLLALADGWNGKVDGLDARLAALPPQPHIVALRAAVALAEDRTADSHKLLDPLTGEALQEPQVLAALLETALQDPETTDARLAELRKAWLDASTRLGRLGRDARLRRWTVAMELRTWGLQPPVRWPVTDSLGR